MQVFPLGRVNGRIMSGRNDRRYQSRSPTPGSHRGRNRSRSPRSRSGSQRGDNVGSGSLTPSSDGRSTSRSASRVSRSPSPDGRKSPTTICRNRILNDMIDKRLKKVAVTKPKKRERAFKYTSNKEQFEFNEEILAHLEAVKPKGRAKKKLQAAIKKLERRNKPVKMADKSKAGWKLVAEYLTDDVASDEEDDRKIKKAEKRALAKITEEREKKKKESTRNSYYSRGDRSTYRERFRNASRYDRPSDNIICFRCGKLGHRERDCDTRRSEYNRRSDDYRRNDYAKGYSGR